MSNNKYQNCTICNAVFLNPESKKCHHCNLVNAKNKEHTTCTAHLTRDDKKKIADFISKNKGVMFKFYNNAIPFIKKELGFDLDQKGLRSIVNSEYYKTTAFE